MPDIFDSLDIFDQIAPDSVAGRAAARLPRLRAEEQKAQKEVREDTIGRGIGQAVGGAVFGLPAAYMANYLDHPIESTLTAGVAPLYRAALPPIVQSAKNQVVQAGNDIRTAATGNAGPNTPPASLPQRGVAAARVPLRLAAAALAPVGVAGVADAADAIGTASDPNAAVGRFAGNAGMTAGAIPAGKLAGRVVNRSGANLGESALKQEFSIFNRTPENAALLDRAVPQLLDKRVRFSSPENLPQRVGEAVQAPGPNGKPLINASGMNLVRDAKTLAQDMRVPDERPPQGPAFTPGQIVKRGVADFAEKLPFVGKAGKAGMDILINVQDSPWYNSMAAAQKARLASLMQSGNLDQAAAFAAQAQQTYNATQDAQKRYLDGLMRGGGESRSASIGGDSLMDLLFGGSAQAGVRPLGPGTPSTQQPQPQQPLAEEGSVISSVDQPDEGVEKEYTAVTAGDLADVLPVQFKFARRMDTNSPMDTVWRGVWENDLSNSQRAEAGDLVKRHLAMADSGETAPSLSEKLLGTNRPGETSDGEVDPDQEYEDKSFIVYQLKDISPEAQKKFAEFEMAEATLDNNANADGPESEDDAAIDALRDQTEKLMNETYAEIEKAYAAQTKGKKTIPPSVRAYPDDPSRAVGPLFASYITDPQTLKDRSPDFYDYFKRMFNGHEYASAGRK